MQSRNIMEWEGVENLKYIELKALDF